MILIISDPIDGHARLVHRRLLEKGAKAAIFDLGEVPSRAGLSAWVDPEGGARARIRRDPETASIDLDQVTAVWFRRLSYLSPSDELSEENQDFVRNESICMLTSLGVLLADRFWVNPLAAAIAAEGGNGKIAHLELARRLGLSVPRTLATNDPAEARTFLEGLGRPAIYKPFRSPVRTREENGQRIQSAIFTNEVDEKALAQIEGVRHAPCIFQERIDKALEVRATVMGDRIFACAIDSQSHERSVVDFRRRQDVSSVPHSRHELPLEVADRLRALNGKLGLVYGAFDLILTPEGRYVFLEVNQMGQFLWLEELAGPPLLEHFTEMLLQRRADFACDAAWHEPREFPPLEPVQAQVL